MSAELLDAARAIAEEGSQEALRCFRSQLAIENKTSGAGFDPVTQADKAAEARMRALIEARFPAHAIHGEEMGRKSGQAWCWVLDPVDGTRGFMCGVPAWTTLVGVELERDDGFEPALGVIRQPFSDETWFGDGDSAHYVRNAKQVQCRSSACSELAQARLATTDPRSVPWGPMSEVEAAAFDKVARLCRVARFGLDAYAYGLLALGHIDLVVEAGLQRYDVSALLPVVRGAGAVATDWEGNNPKHGGTLVVSASDSLHEAALSQLGL